MKLPMLPQDKANHFVYGAILFALASTVSLPIQALAFVLIAACTKEVLDHFMNGSVELLDAISTILGGLTVYLALIFN